MRKNIRRRSRRESGMKQDTFEYLKNHFELHAQEAYRSFRLSSDTMRILCETGLPEEIEDLNIQFYMSSPEKPCFADNCVVIGNDFGTDIRINSQDEVISVDPCGELPTRFVNTNLEAFLVFIVIFLKFREQAADASNDEAERMLREVRKEFEKADAKALCDEENCWAVILEDMESEFM